MFRTLAAISIVWQRRMLVHWYLNYWVLSTPQYPGVAADIARLRSQESAPRNKWYRARPNKGIDKTEVAHSQNTDDLLDRHHR